MLSKLWKSSEGFLFKLVCLKVRIMELKRGIGREKEQEQASKRKNEFSI